MPVLSFDSRSLIAGANYAVNTWHCQVGAEPAPSDGALILAPFKAFWDAIAAYRVTSSNVVTGSRVVYFDESWWVPPVKGPGGVVTTKGHFTTDPHVIGVTPNTSIAGTGGAGIPPQLASVVSWRTSFAGRSGRGRTYLGNLGTAAQVGNVVQPTMVTAVNSAATTLITAVGSVTVAGGAVGLRLWSPTKGLLRQITSGASDNIFDTMRSRVK